MALLDYTNRSDSPTFHRPLFWCALAVAASVFPLIFMGGLVTTHGAGMSVPDWPNSYGYNMFLFPPSQWVGGIFFEHTHRLLGTLSGFLSIVLVCLAWGPGANAAARHRLWVFGVACLVIVAGIVGFRIKMAETAVIPEQLYKMSSHLAVGFASLAAIAIVAALCRRREPRRWVRWLVVAQLLTIIFQGYLGGTRVTHVSLTRAMIHGTFAQVFFCLTAFTTLAASRWWVAERSPLATGPALRLATIVWLCLFTQLVLGVLMRHNGAGLAIPDVPLNYGKLLPPMSGAAVDAANAQRAWSGDSSLEPVSLAQIWLHFSHRIGACVVTVAVGWLGFQMLRKAGQPVALRRVTLILLGLLLTQLTLGIVTVIYRKPAEIASSHVAVGALMLMTGALLVAAAARLGQKPAAAPATNGPVPANLNLATA